MRPDAGIAGDDFEDARDLRIEGGAAIDSGMRWRSRQEELAVDASRCGVDALELRELQRIMDVTPWTAHQPHAVGG